MSMKEETYEEDLIDYAKMQQGMVNKGKLAALDNFLDGQWRGLHITFGLLCYGVGFASLGMIYDNQAMQICAQYSFGAVIGIAISNHIRHKIAMKLFKEIEA